MQPNILFLLVDGLRGDAIFSKNKSVKTPNIDSLITKGTYFYQAISSSDYTSTCLQSIFNSRFPIGCSKQSANFYKIFDPQINLLSVLKNNGYHLYGTLDESLCLLGMDEPMENSDVAFQKLESNIYTDLGAKILKIINNSQEPWFYYVHFMDLHRPFHVPKELLHLPLNERYEKNIEQIDSWIGKILSIIDLTKTVVVITADHGEYISMLDAYDSPNDSSFFKKVLKNSIKATIPKSYQSIIHKKKKNILGQIKTRNLTNKDKRAAVRTRVGKKRELFDDIQNIPLLFCGYTINNNEPIKQQVRSVDIMPTILDLIGVNNIQNIHGRSILPLIKNKHLKPMPVYMESAYGKTATETPESVIGIRTDNYKYFRDAKESEKNIHLYNLLDDPDELNNIFESNHEIVLMMEKTLQDMISSKFSELPKTQLTSEDEKELEDELRKMGYV